MPTSFVIGQIIMLLSVPEIQKQKGKFITFPLMCVLAYSAFIFVPVTAWAFYRYTGWSLVYLVPEYGVPDWAGPAMFLQYFTGMFFGGLLAQSLIQLGRVRMVYVTLLLGILWLAGIWGLTWDQYMHVGTFGDYQGGHAPTVNDAPEFQKCLNIMGGLLAVPAIAIAVFLFKRSRKLSRKWFRPTTY